jgi:NRAMP (natural resistance-associated macrophage protein)-like metal ion transporter
MRLTTRLRNVWKAFGPGLVTGVAGDDPSGITTYSIAGARYGATPLWLLLYVLPFMIAIQNMCARIGALSSCGLAGNIRTHYSRWLLVPIAIALVLVNTANVGSNIYGMAGALNLLVPLDIRLLAVLMSAFIIIAVIFLRYRQIASLFKWFALSLLVYGIALAFVDIAWRDILLHTLIPTLSPDRELFIVMFAILGTTISPYMFFWQASQEAEEFHQDRPGVRVCKFRIVHHHGMLAQVNRDISWGMIISNIISFFIITLTASTLFHQGGGTIETLRDAAAALEPLAGPYASLIFTVGLVGSGLLAIPILAGSAAYVVAELLGWPASLDKPFNRARQFYLVMVASISVGILMPFLGISPVQALFWTAVLNGLLAAPLIMLIIHMANNPAIVGPHRSHTIIHALGISALFFMLTGAIYVVFS